MSRFSSRSLMRALRNALASLAIALSPTVTLAQTACDTKVFFFAEYGDNTRVFDGAAGSVDRFDAYTSPACFNTYLLGFTSARDNTDNPGSPINRIYPYILRGYSAFDPDNVSYAVLRVDVFYQHRSGSGNDSLGTYDDVSCAPSGGYQFATDLHNRLVAVDRDVSQWVAIHMDLVSGRVYAAGIDAFGNPIPGLDYGDIGALAPGVSAKIIRAASDGDLQGIVQDDLRISYVSLIGLSTVPSTDLVHCPTSYSLYVGQYQYGSAQSLCDEDGQYLSFQSAAGGWSGSTPLAKMIEFDAVFTGFNPGLVYCDFCITVRGNTGLRPDTVEVWLFNFTTGSYDMIDSVYTPNSREGGNSYAYPCIETPAPRYISAAGDVIVKLKEARWRYPGVYHLATDELTITTRTVP